MFTRIIDLLRQLVMLGQERNTYALESLNEQRSNNALLRSIEKEQDAQTKLLVEIAAELAPPVPGPATKLVLTLGTAVKQ